MPSRSPFPARKTLWTILAVAGSSWCVVILGIYGYEWLALRLGQFHAAVGDRPFDPFRKFTMSGIVRPEAVQAGASELRDDEEVIGFVVGGRARAYRLDALRDRSSHIVNDLVGDLPVTVAYCDLSDCVRAYTARDGGPLDVSVGGLYGGRDMVLDVGGRLYFQESGAALSPGVGPSAIPLERLSPTRATWAEWKRLHPETDVYEGAR